jgi:DNA polymerase-3 subunit alpha (Gram-positive type)
VTQENENNHLSPSEQIKNISYCAFDLETTGGNHRNDKIIEIGLVKIENLEIVAEKDFLIQPGIKIPEFIQKLTNISEDDVATAPLIEDVIDEILEFMGDSILVAHNTSFDVPFFNSVLRRLKKPELTNRSICTNLMTKYLIPNLLNTNLNYMSKIFSIKHHKAHRALDDAYAAAELLIRYLHIFIDKDIQKINHLYYPRNRYELDRIHFKSKETDLDRIEQYLEKINTPFLATIKGENGVIQFALPCENFKDEKDFILKKINQCSWETVTLKLFGSFVESMVHFNGLFSKMESSARVEIINFMWKNHLPNVKRQKHQDEDTSFMSPLSKDFGDFIISPHLVPEQLIIFPVKSLNLKNQLIFRYPGHQKKLLQFINSKSSRISNDKLKEGHYHPLFKDFLHNYLINQKEMNSKNSLIFKKSLPQGNASEFYKSIEDFLAKNANTYRYPKNYI